MGAQRSADPVYVMGHSAHERERLIQQAGLFGPYTERFLRGAGIGPGMRILDIGCGVGDVSFLCSELVGPGGEVIGIDRDPTALARARERATAGPLGNVQFREGDYRELPAGEPFDAVVGRAVLMYAADPVQALRSLLPHLRPGGIVAFQDFDFTSLIALPATETYERGARLWRETAGQAGIELQMGMKLFSTFQAAGLPAPSVHGDTLIGGGPDFAGYGYLASVIRSIMPLIERFGVATAAEVDIDTFEDRLRDETVAGGGVLALQMLVGAWANTI